MRKPIISIIIPNFGSTAALFPLLKTIPDRADLEVIVVDDFSPNWDAQLLQEDGFPKNLKFFRVTMNSGAGACRNIGLCNAIGEWILFADSDDLFHEFGVEFACSCAENAHMQTDIIYFLPSASRSDGSRSQRTRKYARRLNHFLLYGDDYDLRRRWYPPWSKLIRREMITQNAIKFDETKVSNDVLFSTKIGLTARKVAAERQSIYNVTERFGSLTKIRTIANRTQRYMIHLMYLEYLVVHDKELNPFRMALPILAPWKIMLLRCDRLGLQLLFSTFSIYAKVVSRMIRK